MKNIMEGVKLTDIDKDLIVINEIVKMFRKGALNYAMADG